MAGVQPSILIDVRSTTPALRNKLIFSVIDKLLAEEAPDNLVLVCDHEPAGLGYQVELRKESKGRYEFFYDQRLDGSWVALLKRKS